MYSFYLLPLKGLAGHGTIVNCRAIEEHDSRLYAGGFDSPPGDVFCPDGLRASPRPPPSGLARTSPDGGEGMVMATPALNGSTFCQLFARSA